MSMDSGAAPRPYHVVAAIKGQEDLRSLVAVAHAVASGHQGRLTLLVVRQTSEQCPDWLETDPAFNTIPIDIKILQNEDVSQAILKYVRQSRPEFVVMAWHGDRSKTGFVLGRTLDPVLQQSPCNVLVVRAAPHWPTAKDLQKEAIKVLLPTAGGPNTPLAMNLVLNTLAPHHVTALYVLPHAADSASIAERERWLAEFTQPWAHHPGFTTKIIKADNILKGVLAEAAQHDLTVLGATRVNMFSQLLFGAVPHRIAAENKGPTILVKEAESQFDSLLRPGQPHRL